MCRSLRFLILAATVSVCFGRAATPLVAGKATAFERRKAVAHVTLTADQLNALSRWLERRQRTWSAHITEPSSEPVAMSMDLARADGKVDYIDVISAPRGGYYMRLAIGPGIQWAYRSFAGVVRTRYAQQSISEADFAKLGQVLFHPDS